VTSEVAVFCVLLGTHASEMRIAILHDRWEYPVEVEPVAFVLGERRPFVVEPVGDEVMSFEHVCS
jgi:hypothetical protein